MSIGASDNRETFKNLLPKCHKIEPPLDRKALGKVETLLKKRDVAAFIMEPIICNLGAVVPEREFIRGVRKLCTRYGTLFIADEVATGFGRTGKLFACEHFDIEPDVLCIGKAVTGGYGGLGAVITTSGIAKAVKEDFGLYSTYGWHPRAVSVALANLGAVSCSAIRRSTVLRRNTKELGWSTSSPGWSQMSFKGRWPRDFGGQRLVIRYRLDDECGNTRIDAHPDGIWGEYAYEWNSAQTDATLVTGGKLKMIGLDLTRTSHSAFNITRRRPAQRWAWRATAEQLDHLIRRPAGRQTS